MFARFAIGAMLAFSASATLAQMPSHPVPGQVAPSAFAAELLQAPDTLKSGEIDLAQFAGKAVYLKFWSTGCLPCIQAMPIHAELKKKYGDRLVILGVTPQTPDQITDFLAKQRPAMYVLSDPNHTTWRRYNPPGEGSGTLISPNGRVSRVSVNDLKLDETMIDAALRNEYEPGPPIDWNGNMLPHAKPIGAAWGERSGRGRLPAGQDPYSLGPHAAFQIICRPAFDNGRYEMGSMGLDTFVAVTSPARWIISRQVHPPGYDLYDPFPSHRVLGPDWLDHKRFDLIALTPGIDQPTRDRLMHATLEAGMNIRISIGDRETDGYKLVHTGQPALPPESTAEHRRWLGGERADDGSTRTRAEKQTFTSLSRMLEQIYRVPIIPEHDNGTAYDFMLPESPIPITVDEFSTLLEKSYGLKLVPSRVTVPFILIEERGIQTDASQQPTQ